jgi:hypothetical protein
MIPIQKSQVEAISFNCLSLYFSVRLTSRGPVCKLGSAVSIKLSLFLTQLGKRFRGEHSRELSGTPSRECRAASEPVATAFDQSIKLRRPSVILLATFPNQQSTPFSRRLAGRHNDGICWSQHDGLLSLPGIFSRIRLLPCTSSGDEWQPSSDRAPRMKPAVNTVIWTSGGDREFQQPGMTQ